MATLPAHAPVDDPGPAAETAAAPRLPQIVRLLAAELRRAAASAEAVQGALDIGDGPRIADGDALRTTQGLDLLTQELAGLCDFAERLAELVPDAWLDPAVATSGLTLSGLRARLSGSVDIAGDAEGELELF